MSLCRWRGKKDARQIERESCFVLSFLVEKAKGERFYYLVFDGAFLKAWGNISFVEVTNGRCCFEALKIRKR